MAENIKLPEGFVLDKAKDTNNTGLPEGFTLDQPQEKQTLEQVFKSSPDSSQIRQSIEKLAIDSVVAPMAEVARGTYKGAAGFYNKLDAVQQLVEKIPFTPDIPDAFKKLADISTAAGEQIPETEMAVVPKTIYEMIGQTPSILTEFAAARGLLGAVRLPQLLEAKKLGQLTEVGEFAIVSALDEFSKNPELSSLLDGAKKGAVVAMSFPLAFKGLEILKNAGKGAAKNFIHFVTGSSKAAKDFIKNPRKYNLNPFSKVKTVDDIMIENKVAKRRLDNKYTSEIDTFKARRETERRILDGKLKDVKNEAELALTEAKQSLANRNNKTLEELSAKTKSAIEKQNQLTSENLNKIYDDTLTKYQLIKDNSGNQVDLAIKTTLEKNPGAGIPTKTVKNKWDNVIKKYSPFKIGKEAPSISGKSVTGREVSIPQDVLKQIQSQAGGASTSVTARNAAANQEEAKLFDRILKEFNALGKEGKYPLGYLQGLKKDLKVHANRAYKAENSELGKFYSELSKSSDIAKIASENPKVSKGLSDIAKANKEYTVIKDNYDRAISLLFKKSPTGKGYVPAVDKAVRAINGQDSTFLRELVRADNSLQANDKILPKLKQTLNESKAFEQQQQNMMVALRRKAKQEKQRLLIASKKTIKNLTKEQGAIRIENKDKIISNVKEFTNKKNAEYETAIDKLNKAEEFYVNQEKLRSFKASGTTMAGVAQRAGMYGTIGSLVGGRQQPLFGGLLAGTTTVIGASGVKAAARATGTPYKILRDLLETKPVRELVGGKIINKEKNK